MTDIHQAKQRLRTLAQQRRREAAAAAATDYADRLAALGISFLGGRDAGTVSGFWPIRDEIDVRPLLNGLRGLGWTVVLPSVVATRGPLAFRVWDPDGPMVRAAFGIIEPPADAECRDPDVALVPLLAYDRRGYRVGYGKGHYDNTLAALRRRRKVLALGVAFAAQEVPEVPTEPHDEPLDGVLTELELIWTVRDV